MAADDHKKKASDDDPIARAMQRAAEKKAEKTAVLGIGGGMDAVGVTRKPKPSDAPQQSAPAPSETRPSEPIFDSGRVEPDAPSFFSQSREERAEQARRAAQRVRRRTHHGSTVSSEPETPADTPKPAVEIRKETPVRATPQPPADPVPREAAKPENDRTAAEAEPAAVFKRVDRSASSPNPAEPTKEIPPVEAQPKPVFVRKTKPAEKTNPAAPVRPNAESKKPEPAPFLRVKRSDTAAKSAGPPAAKTATPKIKPAETDKTPSPTSSSRPLRSRLTTLRSDASAHQTTAPLPPKSTPAKVEPPEPKTPMIERALQADQKTESPKDESRKTAGKSIAAGGLGMLIERVGKKQNAPAVDPQATQAADRSVGIDRNELVAPSPPTASADVAEAPVFTPQPAMPASNTGAFAPFEWMIASRYLRARKKEGFVSVIAGFSLVGIMLGVATLIVVMAVMTGFRETLIDQILGVNAHVNVVSQTDKFENYDPLAIAIRDVDGVTRVSPVVEGQVLATGNRGHSGVVVRGMRKEDLVQLNVVKEPESSHGSIDAFAGDNGVAVGANLAVKLGLAVGDYITLISPDGDITPFSATPMPRKKDYKILYVFKIGLHEYDSVFVYMPLGEAQIYFNKKGVVDSLEVITEDPSNIEGYIDPIRRAARQSVGVYTWKDLNGSLIGALDIERKVMFVILTMIILVAALNIISGLVMLVKDKGRDVAILRTMGMARGSILRIFFICGASIGVIGSVAGVILGVLFALNIGTVQSVVETITGASLWDPSVRMLSEIPSKLQFSDVALTLFIALALSFLATLYPAWKASKLDPVEALRYE